MPDIDWVIVQHNLIHLGVAFILSIPIAWDREQASRSAGLRTFPLVAVSACGYMLVGISVFSDPDTQVRVLQGLITGIGFIGGGAILKSGGNVSGTATAASIWNTALIGVAVAYNRYEIAILLMIINVITLRYVRRFKVDPDED